MNMRVLVLCVVSFGFSIETAILGQPLGTPILGQPLDAPTFDQSLVDGARGIVAALKESNRFQKIVLLVAQLVRFDSALCSAERIMFADALVQPTVKEFKRKLITAAKLQTANETTWKVVGGLSSVVTFCASLAFAVPQWKRAAKRARMYRTFIKHADLLFGLLQSLAFKQNMGVDQWSAVRKKRRIAEFAGLGAVGGLCLGSLMMPNLSGRFVESLGVAGGGLVVWGLKPIIAKAIRKKGGVPELEKEFEQAIEMYERTGVVPYGATLDTSKPTGGTVSSATYQDSGTQGASYAVESARDTYLRLLAERAAAKKEAAQE